MKIALVVHTAYPDFIGGREHHVHYLASELSKTDEVCVIAGGKTRELQKKRINGYVLITLPMISIKVSSNPLQIYRIVRYLYKILNEESPDLIHAFEYGSNTTDIACLYSKKRNIPFLITVYGYQFKNPILKIAKKIYDFFVGRKLFNYAEKIFCCSYIQAEEAQKVMGKKDISKKIVFQGNCINIDSFREIDVDDKLAEEYVSKEQVILLTVARILPRKGMKYLVYAMEKVVREFDFKNIKLLILGPDCGELKNIEKKIRALKLEEYVDIGGEVPPSRVKDYIGICDIFVLPSLYEGLPLALLEAMSVGKAVIFSALPCVENVIRNGEDGILVESADVDSLAAAIFKLAEDADLRDYLVSNAKKVVEKFDSKIETQRLRKVYKSVYKVNGG